MTITTKDIVELYVFRLNRLTAQYDQYVAKLEKAKNGEIKTYHDVLIFKDEHQLAQNMMREISLKIKELQTQIDKLQYEV